VLVAHQLPKTWRPSAYRAGPPSCEKSRAKKQPGGGEHAGECGRGRAYKRK
jgi:hypothetical protein